MCIGIKSTADVHGDAAMIRYTRIINLPNPLINEDDIATTERETVEDGDGCMI